MLTSIKLLLFIVLLIKLFLFFIIIILFFSLLFFFCFVLQNKMNSKFEFEKKKIKKWNLFRKSKKDSKFYVANENTNTINTNGSSDSATTAPVTDGRVFQLFHEELGRPIMKEFNERKLKRIGHTQEPLITF